MSVKLYDLEETIKDFNSKNLYFEVLNVVKSGKEAVVYRVSINNDLYALKLYKNVKVRSFKNTQEYVANKYIRSPNLRRAVALKNAIGTEFMQKGWVKREFVMLSKLYDTGCNIPKPVAFSNNALIMEFVGDKNQPAPNLKNVEFTPDQAKESFELVLENMRRFIDCGIVHSDLSEYNILWWENMPFIIDFPQSVHIKENPNAREMLKRDVHNVCKFFGRFTPLNEDEIFSELAKELDNRIIYG